jgi:hypothetical protein
MECPTVVPIALRAPASRAITDTEKVRDANTLCRGFRFLGDALAEAVVNALLKTLLSPTKPSQDALFGFLPSRRRRW